MPLQQDEQLEIKKSDIEDLLSLHNQLAGQLKDYEQCMGEGPPPEVLNELRYALRAVMEWLTCEEQKRPELMQRAQHAFLCAYHDLLDGTLIKLTVSIYKTYQEYPDATHEVMGTKRFDILECMGRIEDKITHTRSHPKQRHEIYDQIYDEFPVLIGHFRSFKRTYLPEIVAMSERMTERERIARRDKRVGWAIGIIGILGTLIGLSRFL